MTSISARVRLREQEMNSLNINDIVNKVNGNDNCGDGGGEGDGDNGDDGSGGDED